jgi:hypothetical protein
MAQLIDKQMFIDEAALRIIAIAVEGNTTSTAARLSYEYAEALWSERERRREAVVEHKPTEVISTVGPQL